MKNWTIGKRLAASAIGSVAIIILLGIVSWTKTSQISRNVSEIITNDLPELALANDIRYEAALLRVTNFKHVMYIESTKKDDLEKEAQTEEQQLGDMLSKM